MRESNDRFTRGHGKLGGFAKGSPALHVGKRGRGSMQRPIKFRAWDKDSKRMHYAEDMIGPGGWVIQFHGAPLEIGIHGVFEPENVELMQYTGLEDKNGKEIYEGDIVRTTLIGLGFWRVRSRKLTDEVVYQPGAFTIGHGDTAHLITPYRDDLEVIGNIYEQPELLAPEAKQ